MSDASKLREMHRDWCFENGYRPDEIDTPFSAGADAIQITKALKARAEAAEAALEIESEWAVIQPNADPMQDERVKALIEAGNRMADSIKFNYYSPGAATAWDAALRDMGVE
jgi:sugar/nucleoside kinase (ribokinase family)